MFADKMQFSLVTAWLNTVDQSPNLVFGHEPLLIKTFLTANLSTYSRKLNFELVQSFQAEILGIFVIFEDFILKLSIIFEFFTASEGFLHPNKPRIIFLVNSWLEKCF